MLSTPMAKMRKGTTYIEIIERAIPKAEVSPTEIQTLEITIRIPENPTKNLVWVLEGKYPIATEM